MSHEFPPPKQPWTEARLSAVLWITNFPTFFDSKKFQLIGLETHVSTASNRWCRRYSTGTGSMVPPEFDGFRIDCSAEPLKTRPIGRNYNDWSRSGTRQNFSENGSETMENDQTGLPSWAAALTAQPQASFAAQLAARDAANRADLPSNGRGVNPGGGL